jgi:hypothetical protein
MDTHTSITRYDHGGAEPIKRRYCEYVEGCRRSLDTLEVQLL